MNINVEESVLAVTRHLEESLDAEIAMLDRMDDADLLALERKRASELKKQLKHKEDLVASGHGVYTECFSERDFFDLWHKSSRVVVHFYRPSTMRCGIVDKHLSALAPKHIEAKFCKINAEKSPYLVTRLKIRVLPTIAICNDAKVSDYIVGFTDLGGTDDFSTEMMEWRLGKSGVINYNGDLSCPPGTSKEKVNPFLKRKPKTIRGSTYMDSDSD